MLFRFLDRQEPPPPCYNGLNLGFFFDKNLQVEPINRNSDNSLRMVENSTYIYHFSTIETHKISSQNQGKQSSSM